MNIEPLESRIAPASLTGQVLTYTDIDGDKVTVTFSKGTIGPGMFGFHDAFGVNGDASLRQELHIINVSAAADIDGANITMKATRAGAGDGLANVGYINAAGHDLGTVTIKGDVCAIDCGDNLADTGAAVKALSVCSMGVYGLLFDVPDFTSDLKGALGSLKVTGDVKTSRINIFGTVGSLTIGGSLVGGADSLSGAIGSTGAMGAVKIGGNLQGGAGMDSGLLSTSEDFTSITIGGSLLGGSNVGSGQIHAVKEIGPVKIAHNIEGREADRTGEIFTDQGPIKSVTVGGSLLGGAGAGSGRITSAGDMGPVKIGGDVRGGAGNESGKIDAAGTLGSVTIGGSLLGEGGGAYNTFIDPHGKLHQGQIFGVGGVGAVKIGGDVKGGVGDHSASIYCLDGQLASLTIGGSLVGGGDFTAVVFTGTLGPVKIGHDLRGGTGNTSANINGGTIASITIGGSLIGGTGGSSAYIFSDNQIGPIKIAHDFIGASITNGSLAQSGIINADRLVSVTIGGSMIAGTDNSGTGSVRLSPTIEATYDIGSLTIKGNILGSVGSGGDVSKVTIIAGGEFMHPADRDLAIGKITVGGRVERTQILAGYGKTITMTPMDGNAQIGTVKVGGDWVASDLVAGIQNGGTAGFGDAGDTIIGGLTDSIAKIASITIGGVVAGIHGSAEHFGFVSHTIGKFKAAGFTAPFTVTPGEFFDLSTSTDKTVTVREI